MHPALLSLTYVQEYTEEAKAIGCTLHTERVNQVRHAQDYHQHFP